RHGRLVVELSVVAPVPEVDRARTGGRHAASDLPGELRVPAGHEGGYLLVACLDEVELVLRAVERAEEGVDPVAGIAVDPLDAPLPEALEHVVGDELRHSDSFLRSRK